MNRGYPVLLLLLSVIAAGCDSTPLNPLVKDVVAPPPQTVGVKLMGYKPQPGKSFQDLFVSNFSVRAARGKLSYSTARDGMPDDLKTSLNLTYGMTPDGPGSAGAAFSDLLLYLTGLQSPQQALLYCSDNQKLSRSNDAFVYTDTRSPNRPLAFLGLRDCEKGYMGLNSASFDFDGDGIPDYLELRCGLNPKNKNDANLSPAGETMSNLEKCKRNIPIDESSSLQPNVQFAYNYETELQTDGTKNFTVTNIPVLNSGQDNFIAFYLTELDLGTQASSLYTAYLILRQTAPSQKIQFGYWATDSSHFNNQEITPQ